MQLEAAVIMALFYHAVCEKLIMFYLERNVYGENRQNNCSKGHGLNIQQT